MSWREAIALTLELINDPSSHVAASLQGWSYPWTREAFVLADLFDLLHRANAKQKPRAYPRPNDRSAKRSVKPTVSQEVIRKALAARGHKGV